MVFLPTTALLYENTQKKLIQDGQKYLQVRRQEKKID